MDLKTLITFKTIIETGSFQNAAQKLNYAQSTITSQIQSLENDLDVKLFNKIGRKMMPTQAGNDLLPHIISMIDTYESMKNYSVSSNKLTGELHIAIAESLLTYKIQPILKEFHKNAPNVKLFFKTLNCFDIPNDIENGYSDIGIYYDNNKKSPNIISKKLWNFDVSIICSSHLDTDKVNLFKENQNLNISLLSDDPNSIYQKKLDEINNKKNIVFSHKIEAASIEMIKKSIISNLGIAVLPQFVYEDELNQHTIKELSSEINDFKIDAVYSYHKNKWLSPSLIYFTKLLEEFNSLI